MATTVKISGTLADFGLDALAPLFPRLVFRAKGPAVSGPHVLGTRRVEVIPDATGAWSVDLVPSVQTTPPTTYTLRIEWLINPGIDDAREGLDVLEGIVVPLADAQIGDITSIPVDRFWAGDNPPVNPQPGLWWLDTSAYPYQLKEWV